MYKLPQDLQHKVDNFSPMQRKYCEYRARGYSQLNSAQMAGSTAEGKNAINVGWQIEQVDGAKEYINWFRDEKSKVTDVDQFEIIQNLRAIYQASMDEKEFKEAIDATELLGKLIGLFLSKAVKTMEPEAKERAVQAFNDIEDEELSKEDKLSRIRGYLDTVTNINKSNQ